MKLHPWNECCAQAKEYMDKGFKVFQQFNCARCGAKQTMDDANTFYKLGKFEECGHTTNIEKNGMNYMVTIGI